MESYCLVRYSRTTVVTLLMLVLLAAGCSESAPSESRASTTAIPPSPPIATSTTVPAVSADSTLESATPSATVAETSTSAASNGGDTPGTTTLAPGIPTVDARVVQDCSYHVVNDYPHDPAAFTQGLAYVDGRLFEGTGLEGESTLREVELETGDVLRSHSLSPDLFGEGITLLDGRIYQLTWRSQTAIAYDAETFEEIERFTYPAEGWGITDDGESLYMSDGSHEITIRDPETFEETGRLQVRHDGVPVTDLNELEWIDGQIYANVWQTDMIVRIDPTSGQVTARIDLGGLLDPEDRADYDVDVLNGIAWDEGERRLFVTGKLWPRLYEIELECD